MKIDVPLEIGDIIYRVSTRDNDILNRTITGVTLKESHGIPKIKYETNCGGMDIDTDYFLTKKDALVALAKRILDEIE